MKKSMKSHFINSIAIIATLALVSVHASAQGTSTQTQGTAKPTQGTGPATAPPTKQNQKPVPLPPVLTVEPDYKIGVEDVLSITVWREETASGDVMVRPDGKITPRMLGDIFVLGLTTDDVRAKVEEGLKKYFMEGVPDVRVEVKAIGSRWVYISGAVSKPGKYPLIGPMNLNQLITTAGGLVEFADKKKILLIRGSLKDKAGQPVTLFVNYDDLQRAKNVQRNNPDLMPGDQVIVGGG